MIRARITDACLAAAAVLLAACATPKDYAKQAMTANMALERASNEQLLVNVVRGAQHRPMVFSAISAINGPIGHGTPSWTVPLPFGPDFLTQVYNLSFTYKPDTPVFTIAPLDTQEFIRGIKTPLPPRTLAHYLDEGWPRALLFHLLVREIEVYRVKDACGDSLPKNEKVATFTNYPIDPKKFADFQRAIREIDVCQPEATPLPEAARYGGRLARADDLQGLAQAKTAELDLVRLCAGPDPELAKNCKNNDSDVVVGFQPTVRERGIGIKLSKPDCRFTLPQEEVNQTCTKPGATKTPLPPESFQPHDRSCAAGLSRERVVEGLLKREVSLMAELIHLPMTQPQTAAGSLSAYALSFRLRSPEAVTYYLGELARIQTEGRNADPPVIEFETRDGCQKTPLFVVKKERSPSERSLVAVDYEDDTYYIPANGSGRSMHVLSLLTQLINLQKKATDLPTSTTVRVVP